VTRRLRSYPPLSVYFVLLPVLLCLFMGSVSCTKNKRADTLRQSVLAVNAARDGFSTWDRAHQQSIVDAATSREDGEAKLANYRDRRRPVVDGFEVAYRALAVAATQVDDPSLTAAIAKATELIDAVKQLTGGGP